MRTLIGTFVLLLIALLATPIGQRLVLFQGPAWAIRDGGFASPPDQTVQIGALEGYYFAPAPGQPTVFFAHGNSSRMGRQLRRLGPAMAAGFGLYYVTYPGFDNNVRDDSPLGLQRFSQTGGEAAIREHWAAYMALGGDPAQTILAAESLGAALMPKFTAQLPGDQHPPLMVILAGFDEFSRVSQSLSFGLVGATMLYDDFDNTGVWEALTIPTFIAHGDSDWLVGEGHSRRIARRLGGPSHYALFAGSGHLDLPLGEAILQAANHEFVAAH